MTGAGIEPAARALKDLRRLKEYATICKFPADCGVLRGTLSASQPRDNSPADYSCIARIVRWSSAIRSKGKYCADVARVIAEQQRLLRSDLRDRARFKPHSSSAPSAANANGFV